MTSSPSTRICHVCNEPFRPKNGVGFHARQQNVLRQKNGKKFWEKIVKVEFYEVDSDRCISLAHSDCLEQWVEELERE